MGILLLPIICGSAWSGTSCLSIPSYSFDRVAGRLFVLAFLVHTFFSSTTFSIYIHCLLRGRFFVLSIVQKKKEQRSAAVHTERRKKNVAARKKNDSKIALFLNATNYSFSFILPL